MKVKEKIFLERVQQSDAYTLLEPIQSVEYYLLNIAVSKNTHSHVRQNGRALLGYKFQYLNLRLRVTARPARPPPTTYR